jgi:hypothetical protein
MGLLVQRALLPTQAEGGVPPLPIWQTVSAKLQELFPAENARYNPPSSVSAMNPELLASRLSFSHFAELITIEDPHERAFYEIECMRGGWSSCVSARTMRSFITRWRTCRVGALLYRTCRATCTFTCAIVWRESADKAKS